MKKLNHLFTFLLIILTCSFLGACAKKDEPKTAAEKIAASKTNAHFLTEEELSRAEALAKSYYNKTWVEAGDKRGQLNTCKPADTNFNGMVSCFGMEPRANDVYERTQIFCGYDGQILSCAPEDLKP